MIDSSPIWQPSKQRQASSNEQSFIDYLSQQDIDVSDHWSLYQWSIDKNQDFWCHIWRYFDVQGSYTKPVINEQHSIEHSTWFPNGKLNFVQNLLKNTSDKVALTEVDHQGKYHEISYRLLHKRVNALAHVFKYDLDIKPKDVIAGLLSNSIDTVVSCLAATKIGATWTSCSLDFGLDAITERFAQVSPKILCTTSTLGSTKKSLEQIEKINNICIKITSISHIIDCSLKPSEVLSTPSTLLSQVPLDVSDVDYELFDFNHPLYILYSSGTTGAPKCIVHGAGGTLLQHIKELALHSGLKSDDTIFFYSSCGWMMWNWLISSLYFGSHVVLYDGPLLFPDPKRLFTISQQLGVNILGLNPRYLLACQKFGVSFTANELPTINTILSTGSVLTPQLYTFIYQNIKQDVLVSSISGGTDIVSCFVLGSELLPVYSGQAQTPGLGLEIKSYDEDGKQVIEQQGELVCRNSFVSKPIYFGNDPTGQKFHNAYFNQYPNVWTHGDYVTITKQGGVIFQGRSDATLNPGGIRIGSAEIYKQLFDFSEIRDAIVTELSNEGSNEIVLFIELNESIVLDNNLVKAIKNKIRINLSDNHVPSIVMQAPELPRTYSGKTVELAVKNIINNQPVKNCNAIVNADSLTYFKSLGLVNN